MTDSTRRCFEPIPREDWARHPRFATQALLLGSHENFRQISRTLVIARAAAGDGTSSAPDSGRWLPEGHGTTLEARMRLFDRWQWAMRSHEHYEEQKLYPFLRSRFGVTTSALEAGHEALHALEVDLRVAHEERDEPTWAIAMARYDARLREHLDEEEALVIPCLLALTPREFRSYYDGSAATVVRAAACAC